MDKLTSILVVIDPLDETRHVLTKAMLIARHFRARLELFLCDSEHAYVLRHAYDRTGVAEARNVCIMEGRRYLESLRTSLAAEDVQISIDVACESPLYTGVVRKVLNSSPDLVIKSAAGKHPLRRFTLDENDWQLARTCPVPLMLTRGRPWRAVPRFAAAVDVSEHETAGLARTTLQTSGFLSVGCRGELDVLYSERNGDEAERAARARRLEQLVEEFQVGGERVFVLDGEPEETLPRFAAERAYDVLVLGALTHRPGLAALVGTLTSRLIDSLPCDFVLVKPGSYRCPVSPREYASSRALY